MRCTFLMVILLGTCSFSVAQNDTSRQKTIEAQIDAFFTSWNKHDFSDMKNYIAADAEFVNVAGMHWKGRQDIQYAHTKTHEQIFKDKPLKKLSVSIRFATSDVAIAYVLMHLEGDLITPDGSKKSNPEALAIFVFVKQNGVWLVTAVENVFVDKAAAPFDPISMRNNSKQ
jgi:uncharacterized protein (TIGR02246 family)